MPSSGYTHTYSSGHQNNNEGQVTACTKWENLGSAKERKRLHGRT